ncbi:hypothetical protein I316_04166 [Kwoniella heveanensis BCC8398]|uniref:Uncharacterized protein n=1 Tax=Kwoniella heveanensis BCC8398 TaxID=1296120 RepID=A0A1B9GTM6_9TREE|nr:hypothetical protein I316_04166 [Kwoniella heveanensis BCC8398]
MSKIDEDPWENNCTPPPELDQDGLATRSPRAAKGKWKATETDPIETIGEASSPQSRTIIESDGSSEDTQDRTEEGVEDGQRRDRTGLLNYLMACFVCGYQALRSMCDVGPDPYADPRSRGQHDDRDRRSSTHRTPSPQTPPSIVAPHLNKSKRSPSPVKSLLLSPPESPNKMHEPERGVFKPRNSTDMYSQEYLDQQRYEALQRGVLRPFRTHKLPISSELASDNVDEDRLLSIADEIWRGRVVEYSLILDALLHLPVDEEEIILGQPDGSSVTFARKKEMVSLDPPIECYISITLPEIGPLVEYDLPDNDLKSPILEPEIFGLEVPVCNEPIFLYDTMSRPPILASQIPGGLQGGSQSRSDNRKNVPETGEQNGGPRRLPQEFFPLPESQSPSQQRPPLAEAGPPSQPLPQPQILPQHSSQSGSQLPFQPESLPSTAQSRQSQASIPGAQPQMPLPTTVNPQDLRLPPGSRRTRLDPPIILRPPPPLSARWERFDSDNEMGEGDISAFIRAMEPESGTPHATIESTLGWSHHQRNAPFDTVPSSGRALFPPSLQQTDFADEATAPETPQASYSADRMRTRSSARLDERARAAAAGPSRGRQASRTLETASSQAQAAETFEHEDIIQRPTPPDYTPLIDPQSLSRHEDQEAIEVEMGYKQRPLLAAYQEPIDYDPEISRQSEREINRILDEQGHREPLRQSAPAGTGQMGFANASQQSGHAIAVQALAAVGHRIAVRPSQVNPLVEFAHEFALRMGHIPMTRHDEPSILPPSPAMTRSSSCPPSTTARTGIPYQPMMGNRRSSYGASVIDLPGTPVGEMPGRGRSPRPDTLYPPGAGPTTAYQTPRRLRPLVVRSKPVQKVDLSKMTEEDKMMLFLEEPKELVGQPWFGPSFTLTVPTPSSSAGPSSPMMLSLPSPSGPTGGYATSASLTTESAESGSEGYISAEERGDSGNSESGIEGKTPSQGVRRGKKRSIEDVGNGGGNGNRPGHIPTMSAEQSGRAASKGQDHGKGKGKDPEEEEERQRYKRGK